MDVGAAMKKYELTSETTTLLGVTLHRNATVYGNVWLYGASTNKQP
jgi:hypothetical protein